MSAYYTFCRRPEAEAVVEAHLKRIAEAVSAGVPEVEAIILTGSFGRGEGATICSNGRWLPQNDYDLVVVTSRRRRCRAVKELREGLAGELGIDFVDIGLLPRPELGRLRRTMFNHDLANGSRVLYGDESVVDEIPRMTAADIPADEALVLLLNRTAGLLACLDGPARENPPPDSRYLRGQLTKLLLACGDGLLVVRGKYSSSAVERARIVAGEDDLPWQGWDDAQEAVAAAYRAKVQPPEEPAFPIDRHLRIAGDLALAMYPYVIERILGPQYRRASSTDLALGIRRYWRYGDSQLSLPARLRIWQTLASRGRRRVGLVRPSLSMAAGVYSALILLLSAATTSRWMPAGMAELILGLPKGYWGKAGRDEHWLRVRDLTLQAWALTSH